MRIDLRQIDADRIVNAVKRRAIDVPQAVAWQFSSEGRAARERLRRFKDIHRGERCFVIANGPSLKKTDISKLKAEHTISMNRAYLMYDEWGFVPTYFTCVNELVLEQFHQDIDRLPMQKFVNFNRRHLFSTLTNYFKLSLPLREVFTEDITRPLSAGGTVTYVSLQLAYYMGFSEVVIVGMDHRFVEKGTPGRTEVRTSTADHSHMHPNYFPKGIKWQLPDLVRSEHAYACARRAFERAGRSVVDATVGGACEVFRRVEFDAIV